MIADWIAAGFVSGIMLGIAVVHGRAVLQTLSNLKTESVARRDARVNAALDTVMLLINDPANVAALSRGEVPKAASPYVRQLQSMDGLIYADTAARVMNYLDTARVVLGPASDAGKEIAKSMDELERWMPYFPARPQ